MTRARLAFALALSLGACAPRRDPAPPTDAHADGGATQLVVGDAGPAPKVPSSSSSSTTDTALLDAPALAVKWTAPISSSGYPALVTVGTRQVVVALDPKGEAIIARAAKDGAELWKATAPATTTWHELGVGKTHAYGVAMDGGS